MKYAVNKICDSLQTIFYTLIQIFTNFWKVPYIYTEPYISYLLVYFKELKIFKEFKNFTSLLYKELKISLYILVPYLF